MSRSWSGRQVGSAAVVGLGALLGLGWYAGMGSDRWRSPTAAAPFGLAVLLIVAAVWLSRSDLDGRVALWVPLSAVVGMGVFGAFALSMAVALLPAGTTTRATLLVLNFASAGGAAGVGAGLFAATRTTTIRTLRDREFDLCRSRDEYRDLFHGVGDAVLVHDTRGRILAVNEPGRDRLGYADDALDGLTVGDVETGDGAPDRWVVDDRLVYETDHVAADGDHLPVEVSVTRVRYGGRPAVLAVARDVSRRRASERDLARARDQLRALNRVLRHDIRNDMQIVLGVAELLEDHVDDEGRERLETVVHTGEHVVELTRSSRDLARTLAGETELVLEPVSLRATLATELDRRRETFEHAEVVLDGEVPDVQVQANDLLASVFRNLVNNAVQHSDREAPRIEVSADLVRPPVAVFADVIRGERRARIAISDDGPGIPADQREAVFAEGESGLDSDGTGLGLALVRSLVEQYGGEVWIEDNEPRGTTVVVDLPVAAS